MVMRVGDIYRLRFPAIGWVRVLPNPPETYCLIAGEVGYLVETIFTKERWWATGDGRPNNHCSPYIKTPKQV